MTLRTASATLNTRELIVSETGSAFILSKMKRVDQLSSV
jgi:hypothetical protein